MEFWKLILKEIRVLKIGVLKIIWRLKFWKLNLEIEVLKIGILKIKSRNWSFEKYLKIEILKNYFDNGIFFLKKKLRSKDEELRRSTLGFLG